MGHVGRGARKHLQWEEAGFARPEQRPLELPTWPISSRSHSGEINSRCKLLSTSLLLPFVDANPLSQAGHQPNPKDAEREHELEIELSVPTLLDQANRLQASQDNQFTDLVEGFLANAILLSRKASEFKS